MKSIIATIKNRFPDAKKVSDVRLFKAGYILAELTMDGSKVRGFQDFQRGRFGCQFAHIGNA